MALARAKRAVEAKKASEAKDQVIEEVVLMEGTGHPFSITWVHPSVSVQTPFAFYQQARNPDLSPYVVEVPERDIKR